MRLLATYRSTGLAAVMFEADGTGSVQYPNGNLWMSYTAETSKGALYSHTGEVTRTWSSEAEEPIELLLDQHLVGLTFVHMCLTSQPCRQHRLTEIFVTPAILLNGSIQRPFTSCLLVAVGKVQWALRSHAALLIS